MKYQTHELFEIRREANELREELEIDKEELDIMKSKFEDVAKENFSHQKSVEDFKKNNESLTKNLKSYEELKAQKKVLEETVDNKDKEIKMNKIAIDNLQDTLEQLQVFLCFIQSRRKSG